MTLRKNDRISSRAVAGILFAMSMTIAAGAQGLDAEGAVETIIGSEVDKTQKTAIDEQTRIVSAIEKSSETAQQIRKLYNAEKVHILLVANPEEGSPEISAAIEKHRDAMGALRQEIEASAILFHAIDSENIMLRDVLAVEIADNGEVTVFAAENDPAK